MSNVQHVHEVMYDVPWGAGVPVSCICTGTVQLYKYSLRVFYTMGKFNGGLYRRATVRRSAQCI